MYSIVLMMAMTSGGDVADFGHRHGGCCGGYESYSSCCGGYSYGCSGGNYSGCCGGGWGHHHHRHHRGWGGCCGGEGYYGGCGGVVADCGCGAAVDTGCTGGAVNNGPAAGGNEEPIGPGHETNKNVPLSAEDQKELDRFVKDKSEAEKKKWIEDTGWNTMSSKERKDFYDSVYKDIDKDANKDDNKKDDNKKDDNKKDDNKDKTMISAPATIIVSLPASATLTIDGAATVATEATRVFTSPALPAGREFHYTLKAQIVRDGKPVVVSKEVTVRAGQTTRANLEAGLANVASR
jgi:uncharacterized protein (TIGR03000 family)